MILSDQEVRIVAEPVFAAGVGDDAAVAATLSECENIAGRVAQHDNRAIMGGSPRLGDVLQGGNQLRVVRGIVAVRPGEAGRIQARCPVERVDAQTAVFADRPATSGPGHHCRLDGRIRQKRVAVLDDLRAVCDCLQTVESQTEGG